MRIAYILVGIILLSLIISPVIVSAQTTQKTNKIFMDPFYRLEMIDGTPYSYSLTVSPPDQISAIQSAIITLQIWHNPTVTYSITVDGVACNTASFTVHTTYANAGEGTILFDCSNAITHAGTYEVVITTDDDTGSSTAWADITYHNKPRGTAEVHGTEYTIGQSSQAKVWLQLIDDTGEPVINGACYADIYTPDGDELVERAFMINQEHDGVYTYDLNVPTTPGVYPAIAICYYEVTEAKYNMSADYSIIQGKDETGVYTDTFVSDDTDWDLKEQKYVEGVERSRLTFANNFTATSCVDTSEELLNGAVVVIESKWKGEVTDDLHVHWWNWSASEWVQFDNHIEPTGVDTVVSNSLEFTNSTSFGFTNSDGVVRLLTNDTLLVETSDDDWEIDYWYVGCEQLSNPVWQEVRGSSELHVNDALNTTVIADVAADAVWNYSGDINQNITNQFATSFWNFNFTGFDFTPLQDLFTNIASTVWNFDDRNLTFYPDFNITVENNVSVSVNITNVNISNIADVWEYQNRTITEFPFDVNATVLNEVNASVADVFVGGTEYQDGDNGKISIRLIKNQGAAGSVPETGALCNVTILDPSDTLLVDNQAMTEYGEGVYTYDFTANETVGVYTYFTDCDAGSRDYFSLDTFHVYEVNTSAISDAVWNAEEKNLTTFQFFNETVISDTVWSAVDRTLTELNFTVDVNLTAIADAVWSSVNRSLTENDFDNTNYTLITELINDAANNLTAADIWNYADRNLTFTLDVTDYDKIQAMVWNATFRNLTFYPEQVDLTNYSLLSELYNASLVDLTNYTLIGELINVTNVDLTNYTLIGTLFNTSQVDLTNYTLIGELVTEFGNNLTAQEVWSFANRNLTYYENFGDQTNYSLLSELFNASLVDLTNYTLIAELINVTNVDLTNYTLIGELFNNSQTDLTNYTLIGELVLEFGNNLTAEQIWVYTDRNLTYYEDFGDQTNYTLIGDLISQFSNNLSASDIWGFENRTLSDFNFTVEAVVNNSLIADEIWNYFNRTLTQEFLDLTNYSLIEDLINAASNNLTASEIWNYENRNLTFTEHLDLTNYTLMQELITLYGNNLTVEDIWSFDNRTLTDFNFTVTATVNTTEIADGVWDYFNRTLTEDFLDLTNYTLIEELIIESANNITPEDVWEYSIRNLTYYQDFGDQTNYTIISNLINSSVVEINYSAVAEAVWNFNATILGSLLDQFADAIWTRDDRNLTYYELPDEVVINVTEIAEGVWDFPTRTLTTELNITVNATVNFNVTELQEDITCVIENILQEEEGWGIEIVNC